jgi:DNA-binding HxlR family transcriptional regulator
MSRTNVFDSNCPIARVTEVIGEPWTLMVLREAFLGTRHFNAFERELGIARNILADRLKKLVEAGLMDRQPSATDRRAVEYRLSPSGRALFPVLIGLTQWASQYLCDGECSIRFVERATGQNIAPLTVQSQDGRPLGLKDIDMIAGPDADKTLDKRFKAAADAQG